MKVLFLNRARGEFWSIEELFRAVAVALPGSVKYRIDSVPRSGASVLALLRNLIWTSRIRDADVIHVTGDIHYAVISIWRTPTVLTIHDLRFIENEDGIRRKLFWLLWLYLPSKRAKQITVISEFTKQRLLSLVRVSPDKVTVIPDCVTPEFEACEKPELSDPPIVLHVGTTPNKNLERLAFACCGMKIELWVLGRLNDEQKADLLQKEIRFREFFDLDRAEVVELYQKCDIVSFVSLYEGFGLPILEGQAVGRPILTSNIAPMNIVSGEGTLQVDPLSIDAIRVALEQLLGDASLRAELVEKGFENVRKYSVTAVATQYYELYKRVVSPSA